MHIKHKEIIKAWLDGAKIQYWFPPGKIWIDCHDKPLFLENDEYRVKPTEVPTPQWHFVDGVCPDWLNREDYIEYFNTSGGPYKGYTQDLRFTLVNWHGVINKILFIRILKD